MIETLGNLSLSGATLAAASAMLASIVAARRGGQQASVPWMRAARWLLVLVALLFSVAAGLLLTALQTDDFRFAYVVDYSERAMLGGYKFAALWAGQAGSLLLWGWLLSVLGAIAVFGWRRLPGREHAMAHACLALVCGFFATLLLFSANPFALTEGGPTADGRGLNPQLQDLAMIIHPPLLFLGYAGFTMPFAMLVGVLIAKPGDSKWIASIRRWVLFSWIFLGAGILMGAWWAYIELGWGGYWAWDPVENASLLPWLTSTALLHSMFVQQHRGMFKIWNASLVATTFLLCIFGTYITRSGVIDSVHAFAASLIGVFFLVFLLGTTALSIGLILWRRKALAPPRPIEGLVSREGAILAANVLLTIMMMVTLIGTIFPLIGPLVGAAGVTVKAPFYNRVVAPMGIALVGLMSMAPILAFGQQAASKILRSLRWPAVAGLVVTGLVAVTITHNIWALLCVAIVTVGTAAVIVDFARSVGARRRSTGESLGRAVIRLIDRDHRRYGGQLAHLGLMMIVVGVAGSSLFGVESTHKVTPGTSFDAAGFTLRFDGIKDLRGPNYSAVQASVQLVDPSGRTETITPQVRFYDKWSEQPNAEIALRSTWTEDLYISLAGWEAGGTVAAIAVHVNPVVVWIWLGGIVMVLGGVFCMLPRVVPQFGRTAGAVDETLDSDVPLTAGSAIPAVSRSVQPAVEATA